MALEFGCERVTMASGRPHMQLERTIELFQIAVGEHSDYRIPLLSYRGTPTGIDIFKVPSAPPSSASMHLDGIVLAIARKGVALDPQIPDLLRQF